MYNVIMIHEDDMQRVWEFENENNENQSWTVIPEMNKAGNTRHSGIIIFLLVLCVFHLRPEIFHRLGDLRIKEHVLDQIHIAIIGVHVPNGLHHVFLWYGPIQPVIRRGNVLTVRPKKLPIYQHSLKVPVLTKYEIP